MAAMLNPDVDGSQDKKAKALQDFLLDIKCLEPLSEWTKRFNMFDILKLTRYEIRHSNMLAWLLDPNENHGIGDGVLRGVIQHITTNKDVGDVFENLLMNYNSFELRREYNWIDILAVSKENRFVLCLENKIDSGEHDDQLNRYRKTVRDSFPGYRTMFIFLTPYGSEASDPDHWYALSYKDLLMIIEKACKSKNMLPEAELMINNYIDAVRRDIVGDEELKKICAEIYAKHRQALDLIFENKPDNSHRLAEFIKSWLRKQKEEAQIVYPDNNGDDWLKFKSSFLAHLLPEESDMNGKWESGFEKRAFYEFHNIKGRRLELYLVFNMKFIPEESHEICKAFIRCSDKKGISMEQERPFPFLTRRNDFGEDLSEEDTHALLDEMFAEIEKYEQRVSVWFDQHN